MHHREIPPVVPATLVGKRAGTGATSTTVLSPVMAALAHAHRAWAKRHAPWLLKEYGDA
jgi:hypothetical protein